MRPKESFKERLAFTLLSAAVVAGSGRLCARLMARLWLRATGRKAPRPLSLLAPAGTKAGERVAKLLAERFPRLGHARA